MYDANIDDDRTRCSKCSQVRDAIILFLSLFAFLSLQNGPRSLLMSIGFFVAFLFVYITKEDKRLFSIKCNWSSCILIGIILLVTITSDFSPIYILGKIVIPNYQPVALCVLSIMSVPCLLYTATWLQNTDSHIFIKKASYFLHSRAFFLLCSFLAAASVLIMFYSSASYSFGMDDAFSLNITGEDYDRVFEMTKLDAVHPPLYYLYLKLFVDSSLYLFPSLPSVYAAKCASVIPYIFLIILCLTWVKKSWGRYAASISVIAVCCMPHMPDSGVTIRMYSFSTLFVACCYIQAYRIQSNHNSLKNWLIFTLFGLLAAYMHYWAALATALIYLYLFIWSLYEGRNTFSKWIVAVVLSIIGYLPWVSIAIKGVQRTSNWGDIPPLTWTGLCDIIVGYTWCLPVLFIVGFCICKAIKNVKEHIKGKQQIHASLGLYIPVTLIATAICVGLLHGSVMTTRHLMPCGATFWLGFVLYIATSTNTHIKLFAAIIIFVSSASNILAFSLNEERKAKVAAHFINQHHDCSTIFVSDSSPCCNTVTEILPHHVYAYKMKLSPVYGKVYEKRISTINSVQELKNLLYNGKKVVFISMNELSKDLFSRDVLVEKTGEYQMELLWHVYNIYISETNSTLPSECCN